MRSAAPATRRTSILDLLRLRDLDPSLEGRKELAGELNIHVAADGSGEEKVALHRAVVEKRVQNDAEVSAALTGA